MKKILSILLISILVVSTLFILSSCSTNTNTNNNQTINSSNSSSNSNNDFSHDYNEIIYLLGTHNNYVESCASTHLTAMDYCIDELNGGINAFPTVYQIICLCDDEGDFAKYTTSEDFSKSIVSSVFAGIGHAHRLEDQTRWKAALSACKLYNKFRVEHSELESEISEKLNALKTKYGSTHSKQIEVLYDWFVESKAFADTMFDFNNKSMLQYQSDLNTFKRSLAQLSAKV